MSLYAASNRALARQRILVVFPITGGPCNRHHIRGQILNINYRWWTYHCNPIWDVAFLCKHLYIRQKFRGYNYYVNNRSWKIIHTIHGGGYSCNQGHNLWLSKTGCDYESIECWGSLLTPNLLMVSSLPTTSISFTGWYFSILWYITRKPWEGKSARHPE